MQEISKNKKVPASFRDPSGFLFLHNNKIHRQINRSYREHYEHFQQSGLYRSLVDSDLLIPHQEKDIAAAQPDIAYKVIQPEQVQFISYPYEWSFSQLKDAGLVTLAIQKKSLEFGMSLKDQGRSITGNKIMKHPIRAYIQLLAITCVIAVCVLWSISSWSF